VNIGGYVICPCGMVTILQGGSNKNQQLFNLYDMIYDQYIYYPCFVCISYILYTYRLNYKVINYRDKQWVID